jgi:uncharacterized membrane protein YfcA
MWILLLPLFGFLIGTVAALTGIGGGVFTVPLLTLAYGFITHDAAGTSLTAIIFTATAATINFARQKRIYYKTGLILAAATSPGAFLGAYITTIISPNLLGLIFGVFMILLALRMTIELNKGRNKQPATPQCPRTDGEIVKSPKTMATGVFLSFFGGIAAGLLGIGGGALVVPIMTLVVGLPMHCATATSIFTMIFSSASGVTEYYLANNINFEFALLLALGTIIGAQFGAYTSKKVSGKNLRRIFAVVLIIVSVQMILKYSSF